MSDEKTVTERQAVERERAAFYRGAFEAETANGGMHQDSLRAAAYRRTAAERYPLPKRQRPLRVTLSNGHVCWWQDMWHLKVPGEPVGTVTFYVPSVKCGDDLRLLARCLDGELEDIPEGEDA